MEYIALEKGSIQRFGIKDAQGNDTGEFIEIDPEDIDFPFRANECQIRHKNNVEELQARLKEIEENCSKDGEFPTEFDNARREAFMDFLNKEEKTIDDLFGDGTTRKILHGRKPYILMFNDIIDVLTQVIPTMKNTSQKIIENIKEKYKKSEGNNVI